jgi:hypothetical protein
MEGGTPQCFCWPSFGDPCSLGTTVRGPVYPLNLIVYYCGGRRTDTANRAREVLQSFGYHHLTYSNITDKQTTIQQVSPTFPTTVTIHSQVTNTWIIHEGTSRRGSTKTASSKSTRERFRLVAATVHTIGTTQVNCTEAFSYIPPHNIPQPAPTNKLPKHRFHRQTKQSLHYTAQQQSCLRNSIN